MKVSNGNFADTVGIIRKLESGDTSGIKIKLERRDTKGTNYPDYSVTILDDGKVIYNGIKNVKTIGTKIYQIPKERIQQLIDELQRVYFFTMKDDYGNGDGDGITIVSIILGDKSKQVAHRIGSKIPRGLSEFENRIDEVAGSKKWVQDLHA
jgi:hypothetical protein